VEGQLEMPPIQGYSASIESARQAFEAAKNALPRDFGQAVMAAGWTFLRDRHGVDALIDHVTSEAENDDFVSKLHAAADKARQQQPQRGRPPKATNDTAHKHVKDDESPIVPATV
jgi:hypothetical protein